MPTYEYQCSKCSNQYEKRESFDAPARQKCPSCGGQARRVLHAPPIVFKGSGFYVTDSRKQPAAETNGTAESSDVPASATDTSSDDPSSKDTETAAAS